MTVKNILFSAFNKDINSMKDYFEASVNEKIFEKITELKKDITAKMFEDKNNEED